MHLRADLLLALTLCMLTPAVTAANYGNPFAGNRASSAQNPMCTVPPPAPGDISITPSSGQSAFPAPDYDPYRRKDAATGNTGMTPPAAPAYGAPISRPPYYMDPYYGGGSQAYGAYPYSPIPEATWPGLGYPPINAPPLPAW